MPIRFYFNPFTDKLKPLTLKGEKRAAASMIMCIHIYHDKVIRINIDTNLNEIKFYDSLYITYYKSVQVGQSISCKSKLIYRKIYHAFVAE